jgi:para-nitrobenzyl esterase
VMSAPLALGALGTDAIFTCPARNADLLLAQHVPTYVYEFNETEQPVPPVLPSVSFPLGACHTSELPYLFGAHPEGHLSSQQLELSDTMIEYWTQFAKTLNPNSPAAPKWTKYSAGGSLESLVSPIPATESDAGFDGDHKCSGFWDTF